MKIYLFIIICFFSIYSSSNAFFGGGEELDLYENIDSGIDELEEKMMLFEANGGLLKSGILKEINSLAETKKEEPCLDESKNISQKDFEDIALKGNIEKLNNYVKDSCKNNGKIKTEFFESYMLYFKKHYNDSKQTAEKKAKNIYNISKVGLFSDGVLENSGFDLITDLEEIDKIIFEQDTDYEGEDDVDLGATVDGLLSSISNNGNGLTNYGNGGYLSLNKYKPTITKINDNSITNSNIIETENVYICSDENNSSGLSSENLNLLYSDINNTKSNNSANNSSINNNSTNNSIAEKKGIYEVNLTNSAGGYNKVTDNKVWPCESFFCINIDFVTYQHSLFGGGQNTIEYLLTRSNGHLKTFANTSLIPGKNSINLFEIGLKDLNLPDIFHFAMQVSTRPVPILRLEKQGKKDDSEFSSKNLLERYYKINGLDYKRRNDLTLLNRKEQDKQSIINSENLTTTNGIKKNEEYSTYLKNLEEQKRIIEKAIDKKLSNGVLDTFEEQYTELDKFTLSLYHYIENLHTIIGKMKEIPIDKG